MKLENLKVNFLGDSITEGYGAADPENIYLNRLKKTYHLKEARNYGVGGSRIAYQTQDNTPNTPRMDFCTRALEMDPDADLIIVFGGTNDYGHGVVPMGEFSDRTVDTYYGACHKLILDLMEKYPGKPIVFMTPIHRYNEDSLYGDGSKEKPDAPLIAYVEALKRVAVYYSCPVIDLWATVGIQPNVPVIQKLLCPDGLHPNDEGHKRIADRVGAFLEAL